VPTAVIPTIWNPAQQGERFLCHHFPEHYRIWTADALKRGIQSAKFTYQLATQGFTSEFHSAPRQVWAPKPPVYSKDKTEQVCLINEDFLQRNIIEEVTEEQLQQERRRTNTRTDIQTVRQIDIQTHTQADKLGVGGRYNTRQEEGGQSGDTTRN
jgi:hypothetical protein